MAYRFRVYRQRNPHTHDKANEQSDFFAKPGFAAMGKNHTSFFQAKLSIGEPGDMYEKQADAVAKRVVENRSGSPVVQQREIRSIRKMAAPSAEEDLAFDNVSGQKDNDLEENPALQMMCPDCEKEKKDKNKVQTKSEGASFASPQLCSRIEGSKGRGEPLPGKTLKEMNRSFGTDFSRVTVHTDAESANMNKELGAQAFTHGNDIYFNSGRFDSNSAKGRHLLAHELTHVIQQREETVQRQPEPNFFEQFAETAGSLLSSGCKKTTLVECPGTSSNYRRLGYVGPMLLENKGSCTLYVHGIDVNSFSMNDSFVEIPPGERRSFIPSFAAVDTAVVCHGDCSGTGILEHPYYCA